MGQLFASKEAPLEFFGVLHLTVDFVIEVFREVFFRVFT